MPVAELRWQLALPWWRDGDRRFAVSPEQVAADPARYPEQWRRTTSADLAAPIHLVERNGRRVLLDGVHRLLRAHVAGLPTLPARTLTMAQLEAICQRDPPDRQG